MTHYGKPGPGPQGQGLAAYRCTLRPTAAEPPKGGSLASVWLILLVPRRLWWSALDLVKRSVQSSLTGLQQCSPVSSQRAEGLDRPSFKQSQAIPWPAPVPFPVAREWHPARVVYSIPWAKPGVACTPRSDSS